MSYDYVTEIANILGIFFKGLSDCQVLTRYTVQLQISEMDVQTTVKIKILIQEFIRKLQSLYYKICTFQSKENATETVINTTLPNYNHSPSKVQQLITVCEPVSFATAPDQVQFTIEKPSSSSTQQLPECFEVISNNNVKNNLEKNYKINKPEITVSKYNELLKSSHSTTINNLKCFIISPNVDWKKNEKTCLKKSNSSRYNLIENNSCILEENKYKNDDSRIVESNLPEKQLTLQDISSSKIQTSTSAENVVHIIVETTDNPSNLVRNKSYGTEKHSDENHYTCGDSNKVSKSENEMEKNLRIQKLPCHICQQEFTTLKELKEHFQLSHEESGRYSCSACCKTFSTFQDIKRHSADSHSSSQKQYTCNTCNKTFVTKLGLTRHIDSHGGKKTAVCDICGKSFRRSDYLKMHCKTHLGRKKYACRLCSKRFILKTQLKRHEKVHTNIKDFVCGICSKGFSRKDKLEEHILRHLNVKKFHCNVCNKSYAENRDLRKHLKLHLKSK